MNLKWFRNTKDIICYIRNKLGKNTICVRDNIGIEYIKHIDLYNVHTMHFTAFTASISSHTPIEALSLCINNPCTRVRCCHVCMQ